MMNFCPVCKSRDLQFIYRFCDGPAMQNVLLKVRSEALRVEKASINLAGCNCCGLVFNTDFNEKKTVYSAAYENTQDYSPHFYRYLLYLGKRLVKRFSLKKKKVVEVGCGKGHFLKILYNLGVANLKGFDPSYRPYDPAIDPLVKKAFFYGTEREKFDFLICRHVLEHIADPYVFVNQCVRWLRSEGSMYFEFPSLEWIVKNQYFFDFFHEHCNYFSKRAVQVLFSNKGFHVSLRHGLHGQYCQLELSRNQREERLWEVPDFSKISEFLDRKTHFYRKKLQTWERFFLWGAGAKGVTFLTRLNIPYDQCPFVIDINQEKQGKFIPITGQEVVSPLILKRFPKTRILIMNPAYRKEIERMAREQGFKGRFVIVY